MTFLIIWDHAVVVSTATYSGTEGSKDPFARLKLGKRELPDHPHPSGACQTLLKVQFGGLL